MNEEIERKNRKIEMKIQKSFQKSYFQAADKNG